MTIQNRTPRLIGALALIPVLALAACGSSDAAEPSSNATIAEAATPFSIGDSSVNEMGEAPAGEMTLPKDYDPYAAMESAANTH